MSRFMRRSDSNSAGLRSDGQADRNGASMRLGFVWRIAPGETPMMRLNARLKAASDP